MAAWQPTGQHRWVQQRVLLQQRVPFHIGPALISSAATPVYVHLSITVGCRHSSLNDPFPPYLSTCLCTGLSWSDVLLGPLPNVYLYAASKPVKPQTLKHLPSPPFNCSCRIVLE